MPRQPDSGRFELSRSFHQIQQQMLASLATAKLLEHASAAGNAAEHIWLEMFDQYLPKRYRAAPAFVINANGHKSRQIDIAIYDHFNGSPLFPHPSGLHIPVESVYAVFEVKPTISKQWLRDAGDKAASVRELRKQSYPSVRIRRLHSKLRPAKPILAGLLAASSVWSPKSFTYSLRRALHTANLNNTASNNRIDLGCALQQGSFETSLVRRPSHITISSPNDSLAFLILHILERLRTLATNSAPDLGHYRHNITSFVDPAA